MLPKANSKHAGLLTIDRKILFPGVFATRVNHVVADGIFEGGNQVEFVTLPRIYIR